MYTRKTYLNYCKDHQLLLILLKFLHSTMATCCCSIVSFSFMVLPLLSASSDQWHNFSNLSCHLCHKSMNYQSKSCLKSPNSQNQSSLRSLSCLKYLRCVRSLNSLKFLKFLKYFHPPILEFDECDMICINFYLCIIWYSYLRVIVSVYDDHWSLNLTLCYVQFEVV